MTEAERAHLTDMVARLSCYYARRSEVEREDLAQACWTYLLRYPTSPRFQVAQSAILDECRRLRRWRRNERLRREHGRTTVPGEVRDVPWLLDQLAPRQRQVMHLMFWDGLNPKEIADRTGLSWRTVAATRAQTMAKLRRIYRED